MMDEPDNSAREMLGYTIDSIVNGYPVHSAAWNYENGLILHAIHEASTRHLGHRYDEEVKERIDALVDEDGSIRGYKRDEYNLDQINAGNTVFDLWEERGGKKYEKALHLLESQLESQPRTNSGSFWHKKIYPYQVWLDGLYMFGPFYARYGRAFSRGDIFDDLCSQILHVKSAMRDGASGLYFHGWDESGNQKWANPLTRCSPHFWGRAVGWLSMALVDILDWLPAEHSCRGAVISVAQDLAKAVVRVQDASGLWFQILDAPERAGNYLEASASSMFAYFLFKAIRMGYVRKGDFGPAAAQALNGICDRFLSRDEGGAIHLSGICKVAGLGGTPYRDGSFQYYVGEPVVSDDFKGSGPFILALCEAPG